MRPVHHQHQLLCRALEAIEQVAAECQSTLSERAAGAIDHNPGPLGVGRLLSLSRRVDALERIAKELSELLDDRPRPSHSASKTA